MKPDAWILPRGQQSFLFRRVPSQRYREGVSPIVEVGPVPMPVGAVFWLDAETETLVFGHGGGLTVIRGLFRERTASVVKVAKKPVIHALCAIDDVLFTGGEAGKGMFGFVDLRAPLLWQSLEVTKKDALLLGKGIDGFAVFGGQLVAVDDIVMPRYLILADIKDPRAPRVVETRLLPSHSSGERVVSVASNLDTMVLLSHSANHGGVSSHVAFMDLPSLEEWAVVHVQRPGGIRSWSERSYDFHALTLSGAHVLVAAGDLGIGVLPIPSRPDDLTQRKTSEPYGFSRAQPVSVEEMRFVPVPEGRVVDVATVDEASAFAVVEVQAGGVFAKRRLDSVLVSLTG